MHGPKYRTLKGMNSFPFKSHDLDKEDPIYYFYAGEHEMNFLYH